MPSYCTEQLSVSLKGNAPNADILCITGSQQSIAPPILEPFFDFIKLPVKSIPDRSGVSSLLMEPRL
jgi:hypothetical protein